MSIDRSKPLPIHDFPSLIDEVARLKELEAKAEATRKEPHGVIKSQINANEMAAFVKEEEAKYYIAMRNAAPKYLDALDFRAGDADAISEILSLLEEIADISKEDRELLTRYHDMAQAMEGKL